MLARPALVGRLLLRFFHGYYRCYCYLPLYVFCGDHLLRARLRRADEDPAAGAVEELGPMVEQLRRRWPRVRIVLRGDSGFCRDAIMNWCEERGLDYLFGLARNERLVDALGPELDAARVAHERTGQPARRFADFEYRTRDSWSRARRLVGKAEHRAKGPNPRFVVTSLPRRKASAKRLYEKLYCARGDMDYTDQEDDEVINWGGWSTDCWDGRTLAALHLLDHGGETLRARADRKTGAAACPTIKPHAQ